MALVAEMVRAFDMNRKVGGSSSSHVETFSVSKTLMLSQEISVKNSSHNVENMRSSFNDLSILVTVYNESYYNWPLYYRSENMYIKYKCQFLS